MALELRQRPSIYAACKGAGRKRPGPDRLRPPVAARVRARAPHVRARMRCDALSRRWTAACLPRPATVRWPSVGCGQILPPVGSGPRDRLVHHLGMRRVSGEKGRAPTGSTPCLRRHQTQGVRRRATWQRTLSDMAKFPNLDLEGARIPSRCYE